MAKKSRASKTKKYFTGLLAFAGIVAAIIYLWVIPKVNEIIENNIHSTAGNYYHQITYDNLDISLIKGKINLKNLYLRPDSTNNDFFHVNFKASQLSININIFSLLKETINVKNIRLNAPQCNVFLPDSVKQHAGNNSQINIVFEHININNGSIHFSQIQALDDTLTTSTENVSMAIQNLKTGTNTKPLLKQIIASPHTDLSLQNIFYNESKNDYKFKLKQLQYTASDQRLTGQQFKALPKLKANEYFKKIGYQTDYINLNIDAFTLQNIQKMDLSSSGQILKAGKLNIFTPRLKVYRDRNFPSQPQINKALPWLAIQELPVKFTIDSVAIKNANLRYSEKAKKSSEVGTVIFSPTYFSAFNVTNDSARIQQNPELTFACNTQLMKKGKLNVSGALHLNSNTGEHNVKGRLNTFKLADINPVIESLSMFSAESGINNDLKFKINANKKNAKGEISFRYNDLNISIQKEDHSKRVIPSAFLNTFAVKSDNSNPGDSLRIARINYQREPHKSVFNFWWKTVLQGLYKSAGIEKLAEKVKKK